MTRTGHSADGRVPPPGGGMSSILMPAISNTHTRTHTHKHKRARTHKRREHGRPSIIAREDMREGIRVRENIEIRPLAADSLQNIQYPLIVEKGPDDYLRSPQQAAASCGENAFRDGLVCKTRPSGSMAYSGDLAQESVDVW